MTLRSCLAAPALATALIVSTALATSAFAQTQTPATPRPPDENLVSPELAPDDSSHLFGNWNGFRPLLKQYGIAFDLDYFAEAGVVASGGRSSGSGYADQRALQVDLDFGAFTADKGLGAHVKFLDRAGIGISQKASGDNYYPAIEIAGGGGDVVAHLAYLYVDQSVADGRLKVAVGRLQVGSFFSANPIYCEFASLAFCAEPRPMPGSNPGFTNGSASNYGGTIIGRPIDEVYVEAGAFEASPTRGGRAGFDWSTSKATGAILPFEIGYEPGKGAGQLPGHYKVGFYYDTSNRNDFYYDINGNPIALTGLAPRQDKGQVAVWVEADQMVLRHGPGGNQGLVAFGGYAHTDGNVGTYQDMLFVGIDDHGLFPSRPADSFGAMFTYGQQSSALAKTQELEAALGEALPYGVAKQEMILEAEYSTHIYRGVDAGPDLQYIIRPGGSNKYPNAFIIGLQANVSF